MNTLPKYPCTVNPFLVTLCFLLWWGMGFLEFKRFATLKPKLTSMDRLKRVLLGSGLILVGATLLLAILFAVAMTLQKPNDSLSFGNWFIIWLGGVIIVRTQVAGALLLFSLAEGPIAEAKPQVTPDPTNSSESR